MAQLKLKHITLSENVAVCVEKSKIDQCRQGNVVLLSAIPGKTYCPLAVTTAFSAQLRACVGCSEETLLLANIHKRVNGSEIISRPVAYSTLTRQFRNALMSCEIRDVDPAKFSLHSLRAGGATAAAAAHAPRQLIKQHGRWRSDVIDRYIQVPVSDRLTVTRAMASEAQ